MVPDIKINSLEFPAVSYTDFKFGKNVKSYLNSTERKRVGCMNP